MSAIRVDQFTAVLTERDAVGCHTLALHELLESQGIESRIYAAHVHDDLRGLGRDFRGHEFDSEPHVVLYQFSTGSPVADHVLSQPAPLVVDYHNITPARFFDPWEPVVGAELDHGRRQLVRLARRAVLGLADSGYNAAELRAAGCESTVVAPILFDQRRWAGPVGESALRRARGRVGEGPVWLFVGRVAPNKAQHDIVAAFALFRRRFGGGHLVLAGGSSSATYGAALQRYVGDLGLEDSVTLAGSVSDEELASWYGVADVFVCLSEHEGFCVPLLEAMARRLPIVAFDSSAVAETMGGAGLVLSEKSPVTVAGAVGRVVSDGELRRVLVQRGVARLADFDIERTSERFRAALRPLLSR